MLRYEIEFLSRGNHPRTTSSCTESPSTSSLCQEGVPCSAHGALWSLVVKNVGALRGQGVVQGSHYRTVSWQTFKVFYSLLLSIRYEVFLRGATGGQRRRLKRDLGQREEKRRGARTWDSPKEENSKEIDFIRGPFWFSPLSKVFYGLRVNCLLDPDRQCTLLQSPTFSTFKGFLGTSKRLSEAFLALQRLSIFAPAGGD